MSTRANLSAAAKTRPPRRLKQAVPHYPKLPEISADPAEFWRAAFLRALAQLRAGEQLIDALYSVASTLPTRHFMVDAIHECESIVRRDFEYWMEHVGGLGADATNGSVQCN